jgi:hypothetical protein
MFGRRFGWPRSLVTPAFHIFRKLLSNIVPGGKEPTPIRPVGVGGAAMRISLRTSPVS